MKARKLTEKHIGKYVIIKCRYKDCKGRKYCSKPFIIQYIEYGMTGIKFPKPLKSGGSKSCCFDGDAEVTFV